MQHVKMRDSFGDLWVAETRVEEYLAAGCVLAADSEAEELAEDGAEELPEDPEVDELAEDPAQEKPRKARKKKNEV